MDVSRRKAVVEEFLVRSREFTKAGQWHEASKILKDAHGVVGDDPLIAADLGAALYKMQRYGEAARHLSHAVISNPGDQKSARRLAFSVKNLDTEANSPPGNAASELDSPNKVFAKAGDPLSVFSDLARRFDHERISGRFVRSSFDFTDYGCPTIDYETHPGYGAASDLVTPKGKDPVRTLCEGFAPIWNYYLSVKAVAGNQPLPTEHTTQFEALERDGVVALRLSSEERATMLELTETAAHDIRRKRENLPARNRGVRSSAILYHFRTHQTEFGHFLKKVFDAHGVVEMASAYLGLPMEIKLANLQINAADDTSIIESCTVGNVPLSQAYYMHMDSTIATMKVIFYRSRTDAASGAFRYVMGSNRIGMSPFEFCLRKASDKSGFDSCYPESRGQFAKLPPFLQKKANFGNDLLETHPSLKKILERERKMTSEDGDVLLFDNNGIHRGAIFESGEREIIQVLLTANI
ncbi:MAG: hypothetical protein HQ481_01880 [Alphaproteobacteria bacterium]|nr:hypothetical protein [Alphaproteobacteria bacterium]